MEHIRLTFLGTGTSQGIPMIGCGCEVCRSGDSRDKRLRSSVLVEWDGMKILVDAGPDFRYQMLRAGVTHLDAILLTHNHKDHTGGLDDIRAFNYLEGLPTEIYCEKYVEDSLRQEYSYAFAEKKYPGAPEWHVHNIDSSPFYIKKFNNTEKLVWVSGKGYEHVSQDEKPQIEKEVLVTPVRGMHYTLPVLGYRFGDIAYCTDMNHIADEEFEKLHGLKHFVINCVKHGKHISHFSIEEAIEVALRVGAEHTWLTHLSHRLPRHEELTAWLTAGKEASTAAGIPYSTTILPAYDGLVIYA